MILARRNHTVGNTINWTVDYDNWLEDGVTIASVLLACSDTSVTVGVAVIEDGHKAKFSVAGGTLNQAFTVSLVMTDTKGQVKADTIDFTVVAP